MRNYSIILIGICLLLSGCNRESTEINSTVSESIACIEETEL